MENVYSSRGKYKYQKYEIIVSKKNQEGKKRVFTGLMKYIVRSPLLRSLPVQCYVYKIQSVLDSYLSVKTFRKTLNKVSQKTEKRHGIK